MKQILMLALVLSTGCLNWQKQPEKLVVVPPPRPAPPVTMDQVHPGNAQQMADALKKELEREER